MTRSYTKSTKSTKSHGSTIVEVVPCGVHPLHFVKVRVSGARSGCPMCAMQIEDICRSFTVSLASVPEHAPRIVRDIDGVDVGVWTRIVGCTCGWRTPPGTTDSDDAYAAHVAIARAGGQP